MSELKTKMETVGEFTERFLNNTKNGLSGFFSNFSKTTADTIGWLSIIIIHASTIPGLLAVKAGITDSMPPIELVAFMWVGLLLYFIRSAIIKDMLNVITIGVGFAIQALLLGFIFFV